MITLSLPRRMRKAAAAHPYPELPDASLSVTEAIAALPADAAPQRPAPTFTPAALRETTPVPVLAEAQQAWTAPPAFTTAPDALRDAARALRGEEGSARGEHPYPVLTTGRATPGGTFAGDLRELPLFRQTAKQVGWCGLHYPERRYGWPWWTTERWAEKVGAELDRKVALARAEIAARTTEFDGMESRRAKAADAALFPVRHQ